MRNLLLVFFVLVASEVFACVCAAWKEEDLPKLAKTYQVIAGGVVVEINPVEDGTETVLEIETYIKGRKKQKRITIFQENSNCRYTFKIGNKYLVYCQGFQGKYYTDRCTPTKLWKNAENDLKLLQK